MNLFDCLESVWQSDWGLIESSMFVCLESVWQCDWELIESSMFVYLASYMLGHSSNLVNKLLTLLHIEFQHVPSCLTDDGGLVCKHC